jgi:hypothetical protein
MRPTTSALLALACLSAGTATAQTASRTQIALTILGGAVSGHSLWDVPIQPIAVYDTQGQPTGVNDTVHLTREVTSSIVVGASATYFLSRHLGVHAEISYVGLPFDDSCTGTFHPDAEQKNQQACDDIQSRSGAGGAVSLFAGATFRVTAGRRLTPYIRANIGVVSQPHSSVQVAGDYLTVVGPSPLRMIVDPSPRRSSALFGMAVGVTTPVSKSGGYQLRIEARDLITSFERVTGPASSGLIAPTATRSYHHFSLILGLDVVLEQTRGRRY